MKLSVKDLTRRGKLKNIRELKLLCVDCGKVTVHKVYDICRNDKIIAVVSLCQDCSEAKLVTASGSVWKE